MENIAIEIESLERLRSRYQNMVDLCSDSIKQLTGYTPDNAALTFTINSITVVSIPICEENGNFCVGFFMSWHQFYSRKLKETAVSLSHLTAPVKVAV